ncbi:hypothetical protein HPB47_012739 [Ixodes persulcatus]|uniref:Uncharacterized protein n=1 Tax=Ixodes persulcatus TaxID=34615 RepID=A0AC60NSS8_IXOPE|nr:hypothetical protein HPB47_012739 [Ixodes persulcatus]
MDVSGTPCGPLAVMRDPFQRGGGGGGGGGGREAVTEDGSRVAMDSQQDYVAEILENNPAVALQTQLKERCTDIELQPCEADAYHERAFYALHTSEGLNCTEWLQRTHCPSNKDRFSLYSHCYGECKEDKLYQYYFEGNQCHVLYDKEQGCLHGRNRFTSLEECVDACTRLEGDGSEARCRDAKSVGMCSFDQFRFLYFYNGKTGGCEMYNFCAKTAFRTWQQCDRECVQFPLHNAGQRHRKGYKSELLAIWHTSAAQALVHQGQLPTL